MLEIPLLELRIILFLCAYHSSKHLIFYIFQNLMNDMIRYNLAWPLGPTEKSSDILKFEGSSGEDLTNHITTFHLWCSSNSLIDGSIRLRLFQCTLTGNAVKWYIHLRGEMFSTFGELDTTLLNYFQFLIHYDYRTKLMANVE